MQTVALWLLNVSLSNWEESLQWDSFSPSSPTRPLFWQRRSCESQINLHPPQVWLWLAAAVNLCDEVVKVPPQTGTWLQKVDDLLVWVRVKGEEKTARVFIIQQVFSLLLRQFAADLFNWGTSRHLNAQVFFYSPKNSRLPLACRYYLTAQHN